jgi:replicative DNA helicase
MNGTEVKHFIKSQLSNYLQKQGIDITQPFHCLNPSHPDNNPSMHYDSENNRVHCFSCEQGGDIIDLIGLEYNLTEDKAKFNKTYEILGVAKNRQADSSSTQNSCDSPSENDITESFQAQSNSLTHLNSVLSDSFCINYLKQRGIGLETAKQYDLSFVKDWISPTALASARKNNRSSPPSTPRLIIPTSDISYVAIDIRPSGESTNQEQYRKMKEGRVHIFNIKALQGKQPCFVVEGEFDALSFLELGYNAVALGSTSNIKLFVDKVKNCNLEVPLILALDNDEAGKKATVNLEEKLQTVDCNYIVAEDIYRSYKDANEYLVKDKQAFIDISAYIIDNLSTALEAKKQVEEKKIKLEQDGYQNTSAYAEISAFKDYIQSSKDRINISTGFSTFDDVLGGGLFEGLYVIGAVTSLGKTTFAMQIADSIASQGIDILYFSLEMSKSLIMSKSISRHTFLDCLNNSKSISLAKTSRGILDGRRYKKYNSDSLKVIENAYEGYKSYAKNLYLREGFGSIGINKIYW